MLRVALLVDRWSILKSGDRIKRRVNLGQLPHVVVGTHRNRQIVFQRFYIGPITGRNVSQYRHLAVRLVRRAIGHRPQPSHDKTIAFVRI
jgi:hypothetical protein